MSATETRRSYSQQEVNEILKRALKQQSLRSETLSHDQLVEMAREVGIDREAVDSATAELAQSQADELTRRTQAEELARERARLLRKFTGSLLSFLVVGTALYFIDRKFSGGTWFYWPLLAWGIGLLVLLRQVFFPEKSLERRKFDEWRRAEKLERRAAREERRRRLREAWQAGDPSRLVSGGAREFEDAVQAGVAALLSVAARKIQDHAGRVTAGRHDRRPDRRL